jgi:hypothetical protein
LFPAAIPPVPSFSGGQRGDGDGGGSGNRRAAVYRFRSYLSRSSLSSPSVVGGGARSCRRDDAPSRFVCPGGVGEAMVATALWNKCSGPLPRPDDELLRRQRRGRGDVYRSPGSASRHLCQVMLLLAYSFSGAELAAGVVDGGRLDLARPPPPGGFGRRRRVGSRSWRYWGVSPVDVPQPTAFSTATSSKAFVRLDLFSLMCSSSSSSVAVAGDEEVELRWF